MDMTMALMERLVGREIAERAAVRAEYEWHRDADWGPFAATHS